MLKFDEWVGNALCCPVCGESYLHQRSVAVGFREKEDGRGMMTVVSDQGTSLVRPVPGLPGRRDCLEIAFECENCGSDKRHYLQVMQHKGQTLIEWVGAPSME